MTSTRANFYRALSSGEYGRYALCGKIFTGMEWAGPDPEPDRMALSLETLRRFVDRRRVTSTGTLEIIVQVEGEIGTEFIPDMHQTPVFYRNQVEIPCGRVEAIYDPFGVTGRRILLEE